MLKKLNNIFKGKLFHFPPIFVVAVISLVLICSWFRYGYIYGGGDVGLPTYNPSRIFEIVQNTWWEVHAPGASYTQSLASLPLYTILTIFQKLGVNELGLQVSLFGLLLFSIGAGMYLLAWKVLPFKSRRLTLLAAIFYMINPFMMFQIWHRFVHTAFFLAASLPILVFLGIKLLETRQIRWVVYFCLVSFIFSYTYGSLPFSVIVWIPLILYFGLDGLVNGFKKLCINIGMFIFLFASWVITNAWWLYPFWTTGPAVFAQQQDTIYNSLQTMLSLSPQSTISMVVRGINPFYAYGDGAWVGGFDFFLMLILAWLPIFVVLFGLRQIIIRKQNIFWPVLFVGAIFLAKGGAEPFGNLFLWGFTRSFVLGAFRNSFEKLGILVPFAGSILFVFGIDWILSLKNIFKFSVRRIIPVSVLIFFILFFGFYHWPMWIGNIFGGSGERPTVKIPQDYIDADQWLKDDNKNNDRLLHLPLAPGDAVSYQWNQGYNGVEPSQLLFKNPSISHAFGISFLDSGIKSIIKSFHESDTDSIKRILVSYNVHYIVLHKDVQWKERIFEDPQNLEPILGSLNFISKVKEWDKIAIYKVNDSIFSPKLFLENDFVLLDSSLEKLYQWPLVMKDIDSRISFVKPLDDKLSSDLLDDGHGYSTIPFRVIAVPPNPLAYEENAINELPSPRFLPDSPFYTLIKIKEFLSGVSTPLLDQGNYNLEIASKRLVESYKIASTNKSLSQKTLEDYKKVFNMALDTVAAKQTSGLIDDREDMRLRQVFARHRIILHKMGEDEILSQIDHRLNELGYVPYFPLVNTNKMSNLGRRIYQFNIKKETDVEIRILNKNTSYLYPFNLDEVLFQVDNKIETRKAVQKDIFLTYGTLHLTPGIHEVSFSYLDSVNLAPSLEKEKWETEGNVKFNQDESGEYVELKSTATDSASIMIPLRDYSADSLYQIDFEYWIKKGNGPTLQFAQDSDWKVKEGDFMSVNRRFDKDDYSFYWNTASVTFKPRVNSLSGKIRIMLDPWDNCVSVRLDRSACKNPLIRLAYNRESQVVVRKISIRRILDNDLFLKGNNDIHSDRHDNVKLVTHTPTYYEGEINLDKNKYFIFSETYHPDWKLTLIKDGKEINLTQEKALVNGYGNMWKVEGLSGVYKFKIEFSAQKRFATGITISIVGGIVLIGVCLIKKKND